MAIYMRGQDASVVAAGRPALLQSKWDKPLARIRYNFERRSPHVQENPESLHVPGKGRYSSASPSGTHPCLNSWYSRQNAFERRRRSAVGRRVRQPLRPRPPAQRDRLHCSGGQAGWSRSCNLGGEETQAGDGRRQAAGQRPRKRKWTSHSAVKYTEEASAEDRETRGHDPSADPGPRPERAARSRPTAIPGLAPKR